MERSDTADRDRAALMHLRGAAALLPAGAELELFQAYLDEGMFEHAFQALREAAAKQDVPFGFWIEMSKAGDALGLR